MSDPLADAVKGALTYHHLAPPTHMVEDATAAVRAHLAEVLDAEVDRYHRAQILPDGLEAIEDLRHVFGLEVK